MNTVAPAPGPVQVKPHLPEGWRVEHSAQYNCPFYVNKYTNESTWIMPNAPACPSQYAPPSQPPQGSPIVQYHGSVNSTVRISNQSITVNGQPTPVYTPSPVSTSNYFPSQTTQQHQQVPQAPYSPQPSTNPQQNGPQAPSTPYSNQIVPNHPQGNVPPQYTSAPQNLYQQQPGTIHQPVQPQPGNLNPVQSQPAQPQEGYIHAPVAQYVPSTMPSAGLPTQEQHGVQGYAPASQDPRAPQSQQLTSPHPPLQQTHSTPPVYTQPPQIQAPLALTSTPVSSATMYTTAHSAPRNDQSQTDIYGQLLVQTNQQTYSPQSINTPTTSAQVQQVQQYQPMQSNPHHQVQQQPSVMVGHPGQPAQQQMQSPPNNVQQMHQQGLQPYTAQTQQLVYNAAIPNVPVPTAGTTGQHAQTGEKGLVGDLMGAFMGGKGKADAGSSKKPGGVLMAGALGAGALLGGIMGKGGKQGNPNSAPIHGKPQGMVYAQGVGPPRPNGQAHAAPQGAGRGKLASTAAPAALVGAMAGLGLGALAGKHANKSGHHGGRHGGHGVGHGGGEQDQTTYDSGNGGAAYYDPSGGIQQQTCVDPTSYTNPGYVDQSQYVDLNYVDPTLGTQQDAYVPVDDSTSYGGDYATAYGEQLDAGDDAALASIDSDSFSSAFDDMDSGIF